MKAVLLTTMFLVGFNAYYQYEASFYQKKTSDDISSLDKALSVNKQLILYNTEVNNLVFHLYKDVLMSDKTITKEKKQLYLEVYREVDKVNEKITKVLQQP